MTFIIRTFYDYVIRVCGDVEMWRCGALPTSRHARTIMAVVLTKSFDYEYG